MDFLFELLFEFIAEGTIELSKSIRVPKYIRYPLIGIIVLFFAAVIAVMLIAGLVSLGENLLFGVILIALALFMLVMGIVKFRKTYLSESTRNDKLHTSEGFLWILISTSCIGRESLPITRSRQIKLKSLQIPIRIYGKEHIIISETTTPLYCKWKRGSSFSPSL